MEHKNSELPQAAMAMGASAIWVRNLVKLRERYSGDRLPKPLHHVARACWKTVGKPVVKASLNSLSRRQRFSTPSHWEWKMNLLLGLHEEETVKLCARLIKSGMTVFDIGAHVGYFTRLFSDLVGAAGKVYAFEPNPHTFALLRTNTATLANVVPINKAISSSNGTAQLFLNDLEAADSLFPQSETISAVTVELTTLDEFWHQAGKPAVEFIKMDVEGAEPDVLRGAGQFLAAQKRIGMVTEFRPESLRVAGVHSTEFLRLLSDLQFHYGAIGAQGNVLTEVPRIEGKKYVNLYCEKLDEEALPVQSD
jgi:FkbM family methyltransferase